MTNILRKQQLTNVLQAFSIYADEIDANISSLSPISQYHELLADNINFKSFVAGYNQDDTDETLEQFLESFGA